MKRFVIAISIFVFALACRSVNCEGATRPSFYS